MEIERLGFITKVHVNNNREDILMINVFNQLNDEDLERYFYPVGEQLRKATLIDLDADLTTDELKEYDLVATICINLVKEYEKRYNVKLQEFPLPYDSCLDILFKYAKAHLKGQKSKATRIWNKYIEESKRLQTIYGEGVLRSI